MRLLANENVPGAAIAALRVAGHDVAWVRTELPGASDEDVLARAQSDGRLLLTFDKDFGELAFRRKLPAECGIVLFRMAAPSARELAQTMVAALASRSDWSGLFSVVEEDMVRMAPLPDRDR